jgi:hypothetical protein
LDYGVDLGNGFRLKRKRWGALDESTREVGSGGSRGLTDGMGVVESTLPRKCFGSIIGPPTDLSITSSTLQNIGSLTVQEYIYIYIYIYIF